MPSSYEKSGDYAGRESTWWGLALAAFAALWLPSPTWADDCLSYGTPISLTGFYGSILLPGQPNYESVAKGDAREQTPILFLELPICLTANSDYDGVPSIAVVQLVCSQDALSELKAKSGIPVTVKGTLFGAETGHHHTQVLLQCAKP